MARTINLFQSGAMSSVLAKNFFSKSKNFLATSLMPINSTSGKAAENAVFYELRKDPCKSGTIIKRRGASDKCIEASFGREKPGVSLEST